MNFDGKEVREEFNKAFSDAKIDNLDLTIDQLTSKQLWWLVKFAKHIRMRCRNNTAFNNYMNRNFNASFREITKTRLDGTKYQGLQIVTESRDVLEEIED